MVSLSCLFPGLSGWAYSPAGANGLGSKKLIVIFLRGAADGLNVVIPYADQNYYNARPIIAIAPPGKSEGCLDLDGTFGLHPVLKPLLEHWKNGSLAFVHSSGSPDSTRSHFDAQDYMESGRPGVKTASSGWLNRALQLLPDNSSPIRAINVGSTMPRILQGPVTVASYAPKRSGRRSVIDQPFISSAFARMYEGRGDELEEVLRCQVQFQARVRGRVQDRAHAGPRRLRIRLLGHAQGPVGPRGARSLRRQANQEGHAEEQEARARPAPGDR